MERSWRLSFGIACAALMVVLVVTAAEDTKSDDTPGFRVEEAAVDLGTVIAGKDAVATFVFHNDTDKDVKIIRAKPS